MYEYQFITLKADEGVLGFLGMGSIRLEDHQDVIVEQAEQGWRFVAFAPMAFMQGAITKADLVFERALM